MFKLPDNIMQLSKSTQLQWLVIGIGSFYLLTFIVMAGISHIGASLGLMENSMQEIAWLALGVFLINAYMKYVSFKKHIHEMMKDLDQVKEYKDQMDVLKTDIEGEVLEGGKRQRIIEVDIGDKSKSILVIYEPIEGVNDDDIVNRIVDEAFNGMTIESARKPKIQAD